MSVTAAAGFVAAGLHAGIKPSGRPDLALVATADHRPVPAAAVFTTNLVAAAPVQLSRRHLVAHPSAAAVILNSGNANAATGDQGLNVAERTCTLVAGGLGCAAEEVLVCSTGLIGISMDPAPFESGVPRLVTALGAGPEAAGAAAAAIMTTDTASKEAFAVTTLLDGTTVTVGGMAKGAAMLSPGMATMLAVLTTDAAIEPRALHEALTRAVDVTFNQLSTDGARSTNDTVILLASGATGHAPVGFGGAEIHILTEAVTGVCASLADQMATDAEGATKFVRVHVRGARSKEEARRAARAVAESQLVKCSLFGGDPYWGRILSELGASGSYLEPGRVDIAYGGVTVCVGGEAAPHDGEALAKVMAGREIDVTCDLRLGLGDATVTTVDLTPAYIDENMRTS